MNHKTLVALGAALASAVSVQAKTADIVVLMDESGSMSGEQAWIAASIPTLDAGLNAAAVTDNRYGLVGFSASAAPAPSRVRSFAVDGGQLGSVAGFATAASGLQVTGSTEDGWAAIAFANGYAFRGDAVRNYILITDEDRDNTNNALSFNGVRDSLLATGTLLNAVVNATFGCGDGSAAIGLIGSTGYKADGAGGFTTCAGASVLSGTGNTEAQYVDLALATGGGAWDLNLLRSGGLTAQSFTNAFIAGKVGEIVEQPPVPAIPEPSTYALMVGGLGLLGWAVKRRRRG
ncbi:PEP-CTERM sorting domain-containing protein [Aquabacterium sp. J223]|uniref:PEP-CTERM sorting domain-containing protein n=1 Tax=Aquabacterium sp. J223 TaxID=2898431 RepID=UPI0021AE2AE5|nr:PEP-CTERM sorting domain-containing protein [Aquabacterium sp. J223]UUX94882.1 PEP-CTERM sorting domain-containing protein [Aquabacterium sp. J223]